MTSTMILWRGLRLLPTAGLFPLTPLQRQISLSSSTRLKQIIREEDPEGKKIVVEGRHVPSPRSHRLVPGAESTTSPCPCPLCKLGLHIKHTDVLILEQFVDSKGKQIPPTVTGLCKLQNRRVDYLLVMAEKAGLMVVKDKDGEKRELIGWEALNKYYDEGVIEEFLYYKTKRNRA